jgi:predicted nucleotidyltransferase component of viral defense system
MMALKQQDIVHRTQMQKLLIAIADNHILSQKIFFKGGTCASMLGYLDRFSVDLDFDPYRDLSADDNSSIGNELSLIFGKLGFRIDNENTKSLFFTLKYVAPPNSRNTLMISVFDEVVKENDYKKVKIKEIDRFFNCQTIESMFANKLVSVVDRYNRHKRIAGRDIYDVNYFFSQGYKFKEEIIKERTGLEASSYIKKLIEFVENNVTEDIINKDLNTLLPTEKFSKIRKTLKQDTLLYLRNLI